MNCSTTAVTRSRSEVVEAKRPAQRRDISVSETSTDTDTTFAANAP